MINLRILLACFVHFFGALQCVYSFQMFDGDRILFDLSLWISFILKIYCWSCTQTYREINRRRNKRDCDNAIQISFTFHFVFILCVETDYYSKYPFIFSEFFAWNKKNQNYSKNIAIFFCHCKMNQKHHFHPSNRAFTPIFFPFRSKSISNLKCVHNYAYISLDKVWRILKETQGFVKNFVLVNGFGSFAISVPNPSSIHSLWKLIWTHIIYYIKWSFGPEIFDRSASGCSEMKLSQVIKSDPPTRRQSTQILLIDDSWCMFG